VFKLGVILLSVLSITSHAQNTEGQKRYNSFGMETPRIQVKQIGLGEQSAQKFVSDDMVENIGSLLKTSKVYPLLASLNASTPDLYGAIQTTLELEESGKIQQKLDQLIKAQEKTNALFEQLIRNQHKDLS